MFKALIAFSLLATAGATAGAQTAPAPAASQAAPAKPQTVKKVCCRRADDEVTTGSRLGSAPKVCKTVEVPAGGSANDQRAPATKPERG